MESQSISLGDLFSVELFVGSITFVLGTVVFLLLLLKLRLNLKTTLLYCCLQLVLAVSLSTIFFMFWRFNYDIMIGEIEVSANNDLTPLVSSTDNYFSYANPDLDMLIGQLGMTNDEEQQKALFRQYGDIIVNDMPFTVLFFRKGNVMSGSKIKSEILPSVDRMFRNIETWSVTE